MSRILAASKAGGAAERAGPPRPRPRPAAPTAAGSLPGPPSAAAPPPAVPTTVRHESQKAVAAFELITIAKGAKGCELIVISSELADNGCVKGHENAITDLV